MSLKKILTMLLLIVCLGMVMGSCANDHQPIKIGFVGQLTGKRSELSVESRNGAQLAIERINADGGINGRRVELLVEDDQGDAEIAWQADKRLIDAGVVAIIGHIHSAETAAVLDQINEAEMVLLSPTAASADFSNLDDYFFSIQTASDAKGVGFAEYIYQQREQKEISVIYELSNITFTESVLKAFEGKYEELGGTIANEFTFHSDETDLKVLAEEVMATKPSAVYFICTGVDAALIIQHVRNQPEEQPILFGASSVQTAELLAKGGQAVEGLTLVAPYNSDNPNPDFQAFLENFEARYGRQPKPVAVFGYEAMQVLAEALKETGGEAEGVPEALTHIKDFPVLQGRLTMNGYGDVERDFYVAEVHDGQFKVVDTILSH